MPGIQSEDLIATSAPSAFVLGEGTVPEELVATTEVGDVAL
jgi:hypothetical protein